MLPSLSLSRRVGSVMGSVSFQAEVPCSRSRAAMPWWCIWQPGRRLPRTQQPAHATGERVGCAFERVLEWKQELEEEAVRLND